MAPRPTSNQELECLLHLAEHGPQTATDLWEAFGGPRGLARTTVLTVLERLRTKGHVVRRRENGVFVYRALEGHVETMRRSVGQFVDRALGGSISPFAAYLSERTDVTDEELTALNRAVRALSERKRRNS